MSNFAQIDLSQLPAPELIETIDYETLLASFLEAFQQRYPEAVLLEGDPAVKVLETAAYREMLLRQDINERARQCLLAHATGNNLEHLAAFYGVARGLLHPGNPKAIPPQPPRYEDDASLRARAQLAPEALSVAGPTGAYVFHALSAGRDLARMDIQAPTPETVSITYTWQPDPISGQVLDASAVSPAPGEVVVSVLSRDADGTAPPELLERVRAALTDEFVRPLTDQVTVQGAEIVRWEVDAVLEIPPGPDPEEVRRQAEARLETYARQIHRLSATVARSGVDAALHTAGVRRVVLQAPAQDLLCAPHQAPWLTTRRLAVRVVRPDASGLPQGLPS